MTEKSVEKSLLYLTLCSALLHGVMFAILLNLPEGEPATAPEPIMVDLQDIPSLLPPREKLPPVSRKSDELRRVPQELAPKGIAPRVLPESSRPPAGSAQPERPVPTQQPAAVEPGVERSARDELFRRKSAELPPTSANLYPSAAKLARIEEGYRKKYGPEVAEGGASFLNTDDILFGSFLRRFENAVYGVWRYPAEAAKMGIEGVTPVKITFNRRGEIVGRELLQSSGSRILDEEVMRTLASVGVIGSFPRGYNKETFVLIAFFHYGIIGGAQRSIR